MNIRQMHIAIDLATQKIDSKVKRKFYSSEIDWILNQTISRYVRSQIRVEQRGGFQTTVIQLDNIRTLLKNDIPLSVYKLSPSEPYVLADLPPDYLHIVDGYSEVFGCYHEKFNQFKTLSGATKYLYLLSVGATPKSAPPYYTDVSLRAGANVLLSSNDFPQNLQGKDQGFEIEDVIRSLEFLPGNIKVYDQVFGTNYYPGKFIVVSDTAISNVYLAYDGEVYNAQTVEEGRLVYAGITEAGTQAPLRLINSAQRSELQASTFLKSQAITPICTVENGTVKVYCGDKFIVNTVYLNYIRKPRLVSLNLNQSCDLPEETHDKICSLAAEFIKNTIQDPNYEWKLQDNQLRA